MPRTSPQVKSLGSTLLLTCQVTMPEDVQVDQTDYNLQWTAFTGGLQRDINSRTGRLIRVRLAQSTHL